MHSYHIFHNLSFGVMIFSLLVISSNDYFLQHDVSNHDFLFPNLFTRKIISGILFLFLAVPSFCANYNENKEHTHIAIYICKIAINCESKTRKITKNENFYQRRFSQSCQGPGVLLLSFNH